MFTKYLAALALVASFAATSLGTAMPAMAEDTAPKALSKIAQCGQEWKVAKADAAVKQAGWPHYWSVCAQRMKAEKTATVAK
jgi:hypothetical protein